MKKQNILIELLHNKGIFIDKTLNNRLSNQEFKTLFLTSIIFFASFGLIIGLSHSFPQAISSTVKVPLLFLITTIICFPTLYFFLAILGLKQNFYQLASFTLVCLTIISGVMFVFAPISFFFLVTTTNYYFFKLLNVAIFGVAGFVGIYIFYKNINLVISETVEDIFQKRIRTFLKLWLAMFGFIGSQLSYTLSPFFGDPSKEFIFFTEVHRNFFTDVIDSILKMM